MKWVKLSITVNTKYGDLIEKASPKVIQDTKGNYIVSLDYKGIRLSTRTKALDSIVLSGDISFNNLEDAYRLLDSIDLGSLEVKVFSYIKSTSRDNVIRFLIGSGWGSRLFLSYRHYYIHFTTTMFEERECFLLRARHLPKDIALKLISDLMQFEKEGEEYGY